jgi:MATE family multidrug resistance protein
MNSAQDTSPSQVSLRSLLLLAWPIILARATQSVIGFTDALMVAPLGEAALAAVTTGALNCFAALILPMGTVFIVQSFAAQLRGRGELDAIPKYAVYGLLIAGASGVISLAALPGLPWVLARLGLAPDVRELMSTYLTIRLWSVVAVVGTEALGNWYGGLGNTLVAMAAGLLSMVLNVVGNYALIEPRFGLPGYGVAGAAWASTLSSVAGFVLVLVLFLSGYGYERAKPRRPLRWSELKRVLRYGLPNGVNWFLEFAAFVLFINIVIGHLGTTTLAAFNIVMQVNSISFMPTFGLASAGAILVGETIGKRAHDAVPRIVRLTATVAVIWMVTVGLFYFAAPRTVIGWFRSSQGQATELIEIGTTMLMLSAIWQAFDAVGMTLSEALRAAGDTAWCMAARIVLAWFVFTPVAWALVFHAGGGVRTVMATLIGYIALLAAVFAVRFASGRWKRIDLVGSELPLV